MKYLLLGSTGQLGQHLSHLLPLQGETITFSRAQVDLTNSQQLKQALESVQPDVIINAAAYTAVDKAESDAATAAAVNHYAVAEIADYARAHDSILFHYSTDYVFDGGKGQPYIEADQPNPQNVYGVTKLAGEQAIISSGCKGYVFRTGWVYSRSGHNFINTILRLAKARDSLSIVDDQIGAPTSVELISQVTLVALSAALAGKLSPGIFHLTASGATSWYGLAKRVLQPAVIKALDLQIDHQKILPITTAAYPLPARRPANSRLSGKKLEQALGIMMPDWAVGVDDFIANLLLQGITDES